MHVLYNFKKYYKLKSKGSVILGNRLANFLAEMNWNPQNMSYIYEQLSGISYSCTMSAIEGDFILTNGSVVF